MFSILFPVLVVSIVSTVAMAALYATITRPDLLETVTVDPFAGPTRPISSADTVAGSASAAKTVFMPANDWQMVTVSQLGEVTDLLDYLENRGVEHREVITLANDRFAVRWK